jgi:hypothetical protein
MGGAIMRLETIVADHFDWHLGFLQGVDGFVRKSTALSLDGGRTHDQNLVVCLFKSSGGIKRFATEPHA